MKDFLRRFFDDSGKTYFFDRIQTTLFIIALLFFVGIVVMMVKIFFP